MFSKLCGGLFISTSIRFELLWLLLLPVAVAAPDFLMTPYDLVRNVLIYGGCFVLDAQSQIHQGELPLPC